jgi:hypothetical protein
MPILVSTEQELHIGRPTVVDSRAPKGVFAAVFEDDGDTGYFYALDTRQEEQQIQDALHIYNVSSVTDRHTPSKVSIGWSADGTKVVLLINAEPHAVFDFEARQGCCRTGFPPSAVNRQWSTSGHAWNEEALHLFAGAA